MLHVAPDDRNFVMPVEAGHYLHIKWCYTVQVLNTSEDDMSTQLDPAQLAIEFLRRDKSDLSPAQYLKRLKQLELEFADLLTLSSTELKEEIYFAWRMGVH